METKKIHRGLPTTVFYIDITLCYYLHGTVSDFIYLLVGCHSDDQFHISPFDCAKHGGV